MHMATRVENEVAIISLASAALADFVPHIVPSVYGWGSAAAESSQGWTIQEFMPGTTLSESFGDMSLEKKRQMFAQMAKILKWLQDYKLPESITGFGGVTFDDDGRVISAAMPTVGAGPWSSYEASFQTRLQLALQKADANPHIKGWRANGIRERLDAFLESGVVAQFKTLESKEDRVIIHADFSKFAALPRTVLFFILELIFFSQLPPTSCSILKLVSLRHLLTMIFHGYHILHMSFSVRSAMLEVNLKAGLATKPLRIWR
jgi:hypothetical protein